MILGFNNAKFRLTLIKNPAGTYHFVGSVPTELGYRQKNGEDLTPKQIETLTHCGPGIMRKHVESISWETVEKAVKYANSRGFTDFDLPEREKDAPSEAPDESPDESPKESEND